jgi:polyhydroxyalkanoate synthase
MPRQINHNAYRLGEDLALTPGKVIYRNPQLELIQYSAQTPRVHRRPLLLIPPQINKFYVFDLKARNSVIKHLVEQGFQLYVISWKNPQRQDADWGLETYIRATLEAMEVIRAVSRFKTINLISACAGGFTAYALLGYLAATGNRMVHSHSLLVTALLPDSGSKLELFATEESLELAKNISTRQGSMDGRDLAHLFAWLRPNDLVWKYWVNNYIMGRQPPPLDVLYWDNDPTRLPSRLHHDFIDMYTGDVFRTPNRQILFGQPIDYRKLRVDTYFIAGEEDYLMPWRGIYRMLDHFRGKHRFVLCDSGHVQSILRPPSLANIHYYTNDDRPNDAELWLKTATHHEGSWWEDWSAWLHDHSASMKNAAERCGNRDFPPLSDAPGEYVLEKMSLE